MSLEDILKQKSTGTYELLLVVRIDVLGDNPQRPVYCINFTSQIKNLYQPNCGDANFDRLRIIYSLIEELEELHEVSLETFTDVLEYGI